jgi:broad specificity phosphatase PhoE
MSQYTYYPGSTKFFEQDNGDGKGQPAVLPRFGLTDERSDRWTTFWSKIARLNADEKAKGVEYKVFFLGRHGEGVHNLAVDKYGVHQPGVGGGPITKEDWFRYWSHRNGDGVLTWGPDPHLTSKGFCDAKLVHSVWTQELPFGIGLPQTSYCSPFTRTLVTNVITFNGLTGYNQNDTIIVENCRGLSRTQTPELRRCKSYIRSMFPGFTFEEGFSENDGLWDPAFPETGTDVQIRARKVLDRIFSNDTGPFVSITTHDDFIEALCRVIGRPIYDILPGGLLPVVIRKSRGVTVPEALQPGVYTIYSVAEPKLIMSLAGTTSPIPDDTVIASDSYSAECKWEVVSARGDGSYYMRPLERPKGHTVVQETPGGLPEVHVGEAEEEPEYVIQDAGMGRYRIFLPSSPDVYTYSGREKEVYVSATAVNNDAQKWYFEPQAVAE